MRFSRKISRNTQLILLTLATLLLISGCLNNRFVLSALYNRADNQIRNEFNKLGQFQDWQKQAFEQRLQTFHYWHRRQEMPVYAALLRDIQSKVTEKGNTTLQHTTNWLNAIEDATERAQRCYPANFSIDLIKSLTPVQIDFIERRFAREQRKNRARYESKTREQRMQERLKTAESGMGHFGFELTRKQKRIVLRTLFNTRSLHDEYYQIIVPWNKKLFSIARHSNKAGFENDLRGHLAAVFSQLEERHPDTFAFNRKLWRNFALEFVQSLTWEQREWLKPFLGKLARNIDIIASSDVSFKPHNDAKLGCLPTSDLKVE